MLDKIKDALTCYRKDKPYSEGANVMVGFSKGELETLEAMLAAAPDVKAQSREKELMAVIAKLASVLDQRMKTTAYYEMKEVLEEYSEIIAEAQSRATQNEG